LEVVMERADYGRMRLSALRQRAAAGDVEAQAEVARRGAPAPDDLASLLYLALRGLILAWRPQEADTPEELLRRRELAVRAQAELEVRRRVVQRTGWRDEDLPYFGPNAALPTPPWLEPRPRRCASWERPEGSSLYPSERDVQRSRLSAAAIDYYSGRRAAEEA
jgi:hypothetical protein